jgi:hypothetical protein
VTAEPRLAPSNWNWTLAIPIVDDAFAVTLTVPLTVDPLIGDVTDTVGGAVLVLLTVTETPALVFLAPTVSVATAVSVCAPLLKLAVFNESE